MDLDSIKAKRKYAISAAKHTVREKSIPGRAEKEANVAPNKLDLLVTVVNRKKVEYYMDLIQSFDVNMQVATLARGTARSTGVLEYLGLADAEKSAIFSFVREDRVNELMDTLEEKFRSIKDGKGVSVSIPFSSVIGKLVYGFLCNDERTIQEEKHQ